MKTQCRKKIILKKSIQWSLFTTIIYTIVLSILQINGISLTTDMLFYNTCKSISPYDISRWFDIPIVLLITFFTSWFIIRIHDTKIEQDPKIPLSAIRVPIIITTLSLVIYWGFGISFGFVYGILPAIIIVIAIFILIIVRQFFRRILRRFL